ncbi:MAG: M23 family metallopeptidase [Treponema sp.]|nr:M23 family metallopeptidase [Treponema sp.]
MEIISYVGFENRNAKNFVKKIFMPLKNRSRAAVKQEYFSNYNFSFSKVKPDFSFRFIPVLFSRLLDNIISRLWIFGFCLAVLLTVLCVKLGLTYASEHTGPIKLKDNAQEELAVLDSIMSSFALDGIDYNENGDIVGITSMANPFKTSVTFQTYTVKKGDTISGISKKFGLSNLSTIIAINDIKNARALSAGQKLKIPSIDGMLYTVKAGNTLAALSARYKIPLEDLLDVNDLSSQNLMVGQELFIPGAKLDSSKLGEILGTLFKNPLHARYRLSSKFGWRADPFTGARTYHSGIDMACSRGTSIFAALPGNVIYVGWSNVFGNYVVVSHANNYQTLYGHMDKTQVKKGDIVSQGTVLGTVGSTGYSTGNHLHFTVYKNGKPIDPLTILK